MSETTNVVGTGVAPLLSIDQLRFVCRELSQARAAQIGALINAGMVKWKIGYDELEEFLANVAHESGEFTIKCENLNYTHAARLVEVWPSRFNLTGSGGKKNANDYIRNPKKLANEVYNGRMGNRPGSDDGFNFKGGGYPQITGRDAYTLYTRYVNQRDGSRLTIEQVAELVQTTEEWAMDSAFWFFCEFKNLEQMAIQDNFRELVRRWNGGFIGIAERQKYYDRAIKVLRK